MITIVDQDTWLTMNIVAGVGGILEVEMNQQELARIEGQRKGRYDRFMNGWQDGATRFKSSDDPDYVAGYEAGRQAKQNAQDAARKLSNHVPSVGIF